MCLSFFQLFITAPILFSIYPPTERLAETIFSYILTPVYHFWETFVNYLPDLFTVIVIIIITNYILKFIKYVFKEIEEGRVNLSWVLCRLGKTNLQFITCVCLRVYDCYHIPIFTWFRFSYF